MISKYMSPLRKVAQVSFIILIGVISYIAFLPNYEELPELTSLSDIINHLFAFVVLSAVLDFGFQLKMYKAFVILLVYGIFIESVQYFLPHRHFDLFDVFIDAMGIVLYYVLKNIRFSTKTLPSLK